MPQPEEDPELFLAQILYREWGRRFTVLHQYLKGIEYYRKSTKFGNENFLWTLLGLAEALKKSGQFKQAAEVAEKCMTIDPQHLRANWTRMEALFDIAEFCASLVYAHRGLRRRKHFHGAVLLANATVEDCVGSNVPADMMRQLLPWIREVEAHREKIIEQFNVEEDEFEGIDEEHTRFKVDDAESRLRLYRYRIDRMMATLYLENSASDKFFLSDMLVSRSLRSANKKGSEQLKRVLTECLGRVHSQQESLRMRRPVYAIRAFAQSALTPGRRVEIWRELMLKRCLTKNEAKFILRQLHEARLRRDYITFFKLVERAKEKFDSYSWQVFPERNRYLDALYKMVARAYIDSRNLIRFEKEETRIAYMRRILGLKTGKLPRDTDVAWIATLDLRRAFGTCRDRLSLASRPTEILWLFHELSKLFMEIKRYEMARFYVKKIRDLGERTGQEDWVVNASHILVRIELAQHNRNEAREAATSALDSARQLGVAFLEDFYERVIEYCDEVDFSRSSGDDSIAARQRLMTGLMPEEMRPRMVKLLNTMEAVPPRRRLSVMPGCKPIERMPCKRATIMPAGPVDLDKQIRDALLKKYAPSKKILGWVDFSDFE